MWAQQSHLGWLPRMRQCSPADAGLELRPPAGSRSGGRGGVADNLPPGKVLKKRGAGPRSHVPKSRAHAAFPGPGLTHPGVRLGPGCRARTRAGPGSAPLGRRCRSHPPKSPAGARLVPEPSPQGARCAPPPALAPRAPGQPLSDPPPDSTPLTSLTPHPHLSGRFSPSQPFAGSEPLGQNSVPGGGRRLGRASASGNAPARPDRPHARNCASVASLPYGWHGNVPTAWLASAQSRPVGRDVGRCEAESP